MMTDQLVYLVIKAVSNLAAHSLSVFMLECSRLDMLAMMIKSDCNTVNVTDNDGKTLLHYACANGSLDCVSYLIGNKV